jgi:DnaD/phage-associated family protein
MDNKTFSGFPAKARFAPIPNLFFTTLLPQIEDLNELKVILHIFWLLYQKRGSLRFVTYKELLSDKTLMRGIDKTDTPSEALHSALELATKQNILLHLVVEQGEGQENVYFLNTQANKESIAKLQRGELSLGGVLPQGEPYVKEERADIFTLYEQNIGLVTPMIAEELKEVEKLYPVDWIEEAIREAVNLNRRNWRYITRILERWSAEGKSVGESRGYSKKETSNYFKGKYGHLVKR